MGLAYVTGADMRQRGRGSGLPDGRCGVVGALAVALMLLAVPRTVVAQFMIMQAAEGPSKPPQGFTVATDEALQNSFGDFQRHVERKAWEKAFATLNDIPAEKRKGMLARPDGVIVPASRRIFDAVAELPAEGRDAFRLFNEAKAKQTWAKASEPGAKWSDQLAAAEKVYEEFFLTSVGDNAADFLGDAAFERGDYENAERFWRSILDKHPDSDLPESRILFKRGLALAEQQQSSGVATVIRAIEQRFPGQSMKIGGKEVKPAEYLAARLKAAQSAPQAVTSNLTAAIQGAPAAETQPIWRTQFLSDKAAEQRNSSMRSNWYYRNGMETLVPNVATDGKRLYANWFGIVFAIDVSNGKLLWRSQKFADLNQHFSNMPYSGANMEAYRIVAKDDIVLAVLMPIERMNYGNEPSRLVCYEADTGKVKWKTMDGAAPLNQMGFVGTPIIEDQEILVLAHGQNDAKLSMVCLDLAGKQKWSADLGTVRKRQTNSGNQKMPQPAILRQGRTVYIASEDGALAAFDLLDRKIRWLLPYGGADDPNAGGRRIYYSGQTDERTQLHTETRLLEKDGLIYVKEAGGRELLAIDPAAPSIVWRRPAEDSSQLVGIDDESVFLLDNELSCINRKDRKLQWATRLPITSGGLSMLAGPESILILTSRGVFQLDRKSGKVTGIFRGADLATGGGRIALVGDRLISVTTQSVTSYPAPPLHDKKQDGKGSQ